MTPASGARLNHAMRSASVTRELCTCGCMRQPTTWRLNRSSTTARYSQPSSVAMYVLSHVHTWLGALAVKSRCSRLGAMDRLCLLSVVTTNFLLPLAWMTLFFIVRRTRSLPTRMPRASSSFQNLGQPHSCLPSAWMARIWANSAR